jgi:ArsR family transcriptional regulator, arsenate/arsenite/antimonite-responsive transcriptional repressor
MDTYEITRILSALAQDTRLLVFRVLLEYGKTGLAAGKLSDRLNIAHNTLSFHLSHLRQAGLVTPTRQGRQLIYTANTDAVKQLITYLRANCCIHEQGEKSTCAPAADANANSPPGNTS